MHNVSRSAVEKWALMPFGAVAVAWEGGSVVRVELNSRRGTRDRLLERRLASVLQGGRIPAALRVDAGRHSAFVRRVLGACAGVRPGRVMGYGELARSVRRPGAARAVGQVLARNPFPLLIPCHRVVGADMSLRGYAGGLTLKRRLLAAEGWRVVGGRLAGRRAAGHQLAGHRLAR
jgi:methylated-DNA-[protein]-cysteine S-methyltransferase